MVPNIASPPVTGSHPKSAPSLRSQRSQGCWRTLHQ